MNKREEYLKRSFTEKGIEVFNRYLNNLVKEYFIKKDEDFPFRLGIVFGIPFFKEGWDREFKNRDELVGRIKQLMQLLWVSEVQVQIGNSIKIFSFKGDKK